MAYKFAVFHFRPTFTSAFVIPADWDNDKIEYNNGLFMYGRKKIEIPDFICNAQDQFDEYTLRDAYTTKVIVDSCEGLDDENVNYDFIYDYYCGEEESDDEEIGDIERWVKRNISRIWID